MSTTAAVVVTWEGGDTTDACVASLQAQEPSLASIVIVDNASSPAERERLRVRWGSTPGVRCVFLDDNRQFAGGLNAGAAAAFADGAERVLLLNNDTHVAPDAVRHLSDALDGDSTVGIAGPWVLERRDDTVLSAGECHRLPLLCLPRTLLRPRGRGARDPYRVSGVMGCALLVTKACFQAVGGYAADLEVYYEDVDLCLGARRHGFGIVVAPAAIVRHDGMRGFASGLTPWAAFLKARNPLVLLRHHGRVWDWAAVLPTYAAMLAASVAVWALRGRPDVVRALGRGTRAGIDRLCGRPFVPAGAPRAVG